jgi:hypothetical protein
LYQLKSDEPGLSKAAVVQQTQLSFLQGSINSESEADDNCCVFQSLEETEEASDRIDRPALLGTS